MEKKLSVKDIADLSGVSVATVSRVINQNGRFSAETEERVKEVIRRYNYHPNQLARGLRVNRTKVIGIIIPDITNAFFADITLEIQKRLLEQDYLALICNTNEMPGLEEKQLGMLHAQQVSGIIYIAGSKDMKVDAELPLVFIDREPPRMRDKKFVFIESDNEAGGYMAAKTLLDHGCSRIACITYDRDISAHECRVRGYQKALREKGMEPIVMQVEDVTQDEGVRALRKLWTQDKSIDGLFCTSDALAIGAMQFCFSFGLSIPYKMRIVGFDDVPLCQTIYPQLTTIHQSVEDIGGAAVEAMFRLIDGEKIDKMHLRLPVELIERGTT